MSREDIMKSLKLTSGGKLTEAFNDLISCDFIRKYNAFGNKNNGAMFQLTDLYTLFYLHYTNRAPFLRELSNSNISAYVNISPKRQNRHYTKNDYHSLHNIYSFFQSFSKRYSKTNLKIDIPSENIHFRMQVYKGKNYFILPKVALNSLNKYMDNERIWQWQKTYIIGKSNVILDSLKVGDIVGDICTGFYKIRKKTSFRLLYFIPPQKIGSVILPYMYNEKANRLYVKNISDYITTPDTKYLYSIDDNHLIWIENTPSYEKIPNEVCRLQIYNHPPLSVERELKEEYFKK